MTLVAAMFTTNRSTTTTTIPMTDRLKLAFRACLIQTAQALFKDEKKELFYYSNDYVKRGNFSRKNPSIWKLLEDLESALIISWKDVSFLTGFLRVIKREDLVNNLVVFEITRELTIYAWKKQGLDSVYVPSTTDAAGYLVEVMEDVRDKVDVESIQSLMQSGIEVTDIWTVVKMTLASTSEGRTGSWRNFTLLVAIAGEIVTASSTIYGQARVEEMTSTLAGFLATGVAEFGSWKDFCAFVRERYHQVYHEGDVESSSRLSWRGQVADVVTKLKAVAFFQ